MDSNGSEGDIDLDAVDWSDVAPSNIAPEVQGQGQGAQAQGPVQAQGLTQPQAQANPQPEACISTFSFVCGFCKTDFTAKRNLYRHYKQMHDGTFHPSYYEVEREKTTCEHCCKMVANISRHRKSCKENDNNPPKVRKLTATLATAQSPSSQFNTLTLGAESDRAGS